MSYNPSELYYTSLQGLKQEGMAYNETGIPMKKVLILTNSFREQAPVEYKVKRLKEVFASYGVSADVRSAKDLPAGFEDSETVGFDFSPYGFAIDLDKDEQYAYFLETKIPLVNSAKSMSLCNNKFMTYLALSGSGIRMPYTLPSHLCYTKGDFSLGKEKDYLDFVESKLSYPLIVKNCYGSLGRQVYLVRDRKELESLETNLALEQHLFQKFVKSSVGQDFRILVVGGKAVAWMKRKNDHDFRSNIALGGVGYAVEPPEEYKRTAEKAASLLGLDYGGVDLLIGEHGEPVLSEVNSNAFFSEIEKISRVDVTKILVERLLRKYPL